MNEIAEYWNRQPCGSLHPDPTAQRFFTQPHIPLFAEFWKWKGKRVLEIGCGIGTDTMEFVNQGAWVYAVDQSDKSIEMALKRCPQAAYHVANAEEWLPAGSFDLVYSFGVLHHTPHPEKILNRLKLRDDGQLRIMLYAKYSWKHLFTRQQPEAQAGCPLVKWYSFRDVKKLLSSCGFKVLRIEKTHIFPWRIKDYREHRFVKAFPWNICPQWLFRRLEHILGHHLLVVAKKEV
jgi:SAM-dependent methyltransferase